ncbi:DUF493 domain-containing protein [Marinomonas mediterranea]|jgi:Uncharacterized conserved protein|uniref:Uncharacterized protein n=1 Tax=Marinomonas mediterranea (strain ATCC 700492 / JCM 21426 / NBRC 103028 / MMB-1) TaxID=717774 RepID=F2JY11_MARM1|nr:DUF493 domain-containing protein [Marinomonas mediterranea]ADZ90747.1 protein of unknown function DUF493 [Marinomonas mediterranea MMB-1]WCN08789.1 DUF493 family protein [Marinomonas mediterranea]WCN12835.1 DUF493 family protein [Marinomonas mediterranea]WCN16902.1 DUF493 family protein [Marinomonas mediterranea MMB-1]
MALITKNGAPAADPADAPKIEFPCENYLIKVVALDVDGGFDELVACLNTLAPELDCSTITNNRSSKGRFISYSFRIIAQSEAHLAELDAALKAIQSIKMVM